MLLTALSYFFAYSTLVTQCFTLLRRSGEFAIRSQ